MIVTLIKKDLYEYKNNILKTLLYLLVSICLPLILLNYLGLSTLYFSDMHTMVKFVLMLFGCVIYSETTLFQVYRDVRQGIYEKYFIAKIKGFDIFVSKCILNYAILLIIVLVIFLLNELFGQMFTNNIVFAVDIVMIVELFFISIIGTSLAFMNALIIRNEKNATSYGISCFVVFGGYMKIIELLGISNLFLELLFVVILSLIFAMIVIKLIKHNKFISKA